MRQLGSPIATIATAIAAIATAIAAAASAAAASAASTAAVWWGRDWRWLSESTSNGSSLAAPFAAVLVLATVTVAAAVAAVAAAAAAACCERVPPTPALPRSAACPKRSAVVPLLAEVCAAGGCTIS